MSGGGDEWGLFRCRCRAPSPPPPTPVIINAAASPTVIVVGVLGGVATVMAMAMVFMAACFVRRRGAPPPADDLEDLLPQRPPNIINAADAADLMDGGDG